MHSHPDHGHGHAHHFNTHSRAFALGVTLNLAFVAIEAAYGLLSGSLALLADAGHNLSDVLGLVMAWGASWLATRKATDRNTYGLKKSTVLAALFNALFLIAAVGGIAWEAIRRFSDPAEVTGLTVLVVAGIGVLVNGATMLLFLKGQDDDLNIRGAFLHMAADTAVSVGVVVAGLLIMITGQAWIDPLVSLVIAVVIFIGTWRLLKDSLNLAVDAVPRDIDPDAVFQRLRQLPGVTSVHHLHIWGLSTTENALTVHLVKPEPGHNDEVIEAATEMLAHDFNIRHVTIQVEQSASGCPNMAYC
ncbi:cation diffusion facilitator family transporter [Marinobacter lutaoensis]|jgi:cobalt-zinc-cadmium efflux system protein|uniref:Cation transporter n=1 Tax=Marinobacter lutaoensis TaxID=135739 RepID=A0A1V2DS26_9GAMM|nr:cation diffusion facilitator family transporter [Marinobacter lutaoensis]NVD34837.1 cation transporter [Marinobacter lutaoensis]ONF43141.1 cation transporter [Marinobacter lutaoensis]